MSHKLSLNDLVVSTAHIISELANGALVSVPIGIKGRILMITSHSEYEAPSYFIHWNDEENNKKFAANAYANQLAKHE